MKTLLMAGVAAVVFVALVAWFLVQVDLDLEELRNRGEEVDE